MQIDRVFFCYLLRDPSEDTVHHLDRIACKCYYVYHWVYSMQYGTWNPLLNELDVELRDVHTPEDLYDFLNNKIDAIQEFADQP